MTGCRIGEALALTWNDYDIDNEVIHIKRTLSYVKSDSGHYSIKLNSPKTTAGQRLIPLYDGLKEFIRENFNKSEGADYIFSGYTGNPIHPSAVNRAIRQLVREYNASEYRKNNRLPPLPLISAHTFRHTFCHRLCEADVNMKAIQMLMGHSDIRITMNIYAEVSKQKMLASVLEIQDKLAV